MVGICLGSGWCKPVVRKGEGAGGELIALVAVTEERGKVQGKCNNSHTHARRCIILDHLWASLGTLVMMSYQVC